MKQPVGAFVRERALVRVTLEGSTCIRFLEVVTDSVYRQSSVGLLVPGSADELALRLCICRVMGVSCCRARSRVK